jgi:hypothetical protein
MTNLPEKVYTEKEVASARARSQWVGRLQGAGAVVGLGMLWNLLGWIPALLGLGVVVWVLFKVFGSDEDESSGPS